MTRIAVSGHRGFTPEVSAFIADALRAELATYDAGDLVGLSCLADGADQLFARAVLEHGGRIEVFVPAEQYREASLPSESWPSYDALLARASQVHRLDHQESTARSHMDASQAMLATADLLIAVWDGQPARGYGGTADVVAAAREAGLPVTVVWPEGAWR